MLQTSAEKMRRGEMRSGGEDGMPLVEAGNGGTTSGLVCRTTSCVEDPQKSAMEALKSGELRLLSDILADLKDQVEVNLEYKTETFKTLLQVAVERGDQDAVQLIIRGGGNAGHVNSHLKNTCLHVAAGQAKPEILRMLLENGGKRSVSVPDRAGRTPLHHSVLPAAKQPVQALHCLRLCVEAGSDLNRTDNKGGQTPLHLAAVGGQFDLVKYLLEAGADHTTSCQGLSTKQLICETFTKDEVSQLDLTSKHMSKLNIRKRLVDLLDVAELDGPDDVKFRAAVSFVKPSDIDNVGDDRKSLVQLAGERGLDSYLAILLERGASPNTTTPSHTATPLLLAASNGYPAVLEVLLQHNRSIGQAGGKSDRQADGKSDRQADGKSDRQVDFHTTDSQGMTVLHNILRKPRLNLNHGEPADNNSEVYETCLNLLLESESTNFARIINNQDINGNTPLHYAVQFWSQECVTKLLLLGANIGLKNLLGESPISGILPQTMEDFLNTHCLTSQGNPTNDEFKITFKYDFLAPPRESLPRDLCPPETSGGKLENQTEILGYTGYRSPMPETEVLWYMAGSKDHRHLLKHPVITSFLSLKWSRISLHYNSNLIFFIALVCCLTSYIFCNYAGDSLGVSSPNCTNSDSSSYMFFAVSGSSNVNSPALWWTVTLLVFLLFTRELFQFSIAGVRYFHSWENILEIALLGVTSFLLFFDEPGCILQTKRELSSAAIMLSWIEVVTMIGRYPLLTNYNTYLTMFYRVLNSFLLFLTWFSLFIFAFGFSFYILLHKDIGQEEAEYPYFDSLGLTLVKTFSMFVGELEFSDLPLSSPYSYLFFLVFLFLIVVVLMNLLNGLAVSDTGIIRDEAEIHSHVCRVEVISAAEATILGDPGHIFTGPGLIIPSCGLRRKLGSLLRVRKVFQRMVGSHGILLFYSVLPDKRMEIFPNKRTAICPPYQEIGREIMESAKNLILRLRKEEREKEGLETALHSIRMRQSSMEDKMDKILDKLENITNSLRL